MRKFIRWVFNLDKMSILTQKLSAYKDHSKQLESEVEMLKEYKLKYEIAKLALEDDPLLEVLTNSAHQQQAAYYALHGNFGAMGSIKTKEHVELMERLSVG